MLDDALLPGARAHDATSPKPRTVRRHAAARLVAERTHAGRTVLTHAHASSPLRFVQPTFPDSWAASVCLVTFGGGLIDGDVIDVEFHVDPGATLVVFTQGTTKAFRGHSAQRFRALVHGTLVLLPDPVACFADAHFEQRVDITLHGDGSVVALDGFTSGRPAYGERWAFASLDLETIVRTDTRVVVRDAMRIVRSSHRDITSHFAEFEAMCTLLAVGPRVASIVDGLLDPAHVSPSAMVAPSRLPSAPSGSSAAVVRIAATSPALAIDHARRRLRNLPDIGVVDPFVSRH